MPQSKHVMSGAKKFDRQKTKQLTSAVADEYLAEGVKNEEAGEKWRAGDAAKSTRFFVRALDDYQAGLQKFPGNFDLAYNKARLQYDLSQQSRLVDQLPFSSIELLDLALESHRYALELNQGNADLLFNTAQVLTSIAEAATETGSTAIASDDTLRLLQEALEHFRQCLSLQEYLLTQSGEFEEDATSSLAQGLDQMSDLKSRSPPNMVEEEVWASVEEPVTENSLIDTLMAQLGTLTTICDVLSACSSGNLGWVGEFYREMLQGKIGLLSDGSERLEEINLTMARFSTAFAKANFHSGAIDISTYERDFTAAYSANQDLLENEQGLYNFADAEMTFVTSVLISLEGNVYDSGSNSLQLNGILWRHITKALEHLTAATKLPQAEYLVRSHLRRGDCELMRYGLSKGAHPFELAAKSAPTLIKNAEIFYRGAAKLGYSYGATEEEREALIKEAVAAKLSGSPDKFNSLLSKEKELTLEVVGVMQDEHLLWPTAKTTLESDLCTLC